MGGSFWVVVLGVVWGVVFGMVWGVVLGVVLGIVFGVALGLGGPEAPSAHLHAAVTEATTAVV